MTVQAYQTKDRSYFERARQDILSLFPHEGVGCVLEVGCGNGATLRMLKDRGLAAEVHGMELMEEVAQEAELCVDRVFVGNAVALLPSLSQGQYDVVLCLDVLEHLVDPWSFVEQLQGVLKPGGCMIASIPNLRTLPVIWRLLVKGNFDYANQGIMDKTHLRFFTKKTALSLLQREGLRLASWKRTDFAPWSKSAVFNGLTFGLFRDLLTEQYLVKAIKTEL
jgi:2-polyprenyl-3-methyl-5-hydroxy-6-metoxy-1,4-benzoquinol methylase